MRDHNLNDLIIDDIEPKNSKTKSLLTIISLFVIILFVVIIITKILINSPQEEQPVAQNDNPSMIAPELKLQENTLPQDPLETNQSESSLSNILEETTPAPVDTPSSETKEALTPDAVAPEAKTTMEQTSVNNQIKQTSPITPPEDKSVEPAPIEEKKPEPLQPKITPKPVVKKVTKPKPTVNLQTYYIQVGSFSTTPNDRFISVIKNRGFEYQIQTHNGVKKILIGPYKGRAAVDQALPQIRNLITKSAFVVAK
ncbi:MAG: hypothetical protein RLZZ428_791 [Pseudomonadota bacterium]